MQVKKSKPSPESQPEPKTETTNHNAEITNQKSEPVISAEIKSQTPKANKGNSRLIILDIYIVGTSVKYYFSDKSVGDR